MRKLQRSGLEIASLQKMKFRFFAFSFFLVLGLFSNSSVSVTAHAANEKSPTLSARPIVGFLATGKQGQKLTSAVESELRAVLNDREVVSRNKVIPYGASTGEVKRAVSELEKNAKLLVALDPLAAAYAKKFGWPHIAMVEAVPLSSFVQAIQNDFEQFKKLGPFSSVTILVSPDFLKNVRSTREAVAALGSKMGLDIHLSSELSQHDLSTDTVASSSAVYFSKFYEPQYAELNSILPQLNEKKVLTLSGQGIHLVSQGVLAATAVPAQTEDMREMREARAIAMRIRDALSGRKSESIASSVAFGESTRLAINERTLRQVHANPSMEVLRYAFFVEQVGAQVGANDTESGSAEAGTAATMGLSEVALAAVQNNLDLEAARHAAQAQAEDGGIARSEFFPKIDLIGSYLKLDNNLSTASQGLIPNSAVAGMVVARQLIFSEPAIAQLSVKNRLSEIGELNSDRVKLEVVRGALRAYVTVLQARQQNNLRQEDLSRTEANLVAVRARRSAGVINNSDVFRWESQVAQAKKNLFDAQMQEKAAEVSFNRILRRPLDSAVLIREVSLDDPNLWTSDKEFRKGIAKLEGFSRLEAFLVAQSLGESPETKVLDQQVSTTERGLTSARAKFYLPTLFAQGLVSHTFSSNASASSGILTVPGIPAPLVLPTVNTTQWAFSLNLTLNLFSGGADLARVRQDSEKLHQMEVTRDSSRNLIEENLRRALLQVRATYVAIDLVKASAESANKSYELVRQAYVRGARSITDVIDAQNAAFTAQVASSSAVYSYLQAYFDLQRIVGKYDVLQSEQERKDMLAALEGT